MTALVVSTGYEPRPLQRELHRRLRRFSVLVCHRRFGKTVLAINELIDRAIRCTLPNPRYAYIAPLRNQAKAIAWDYLQQYTRPIPGVTFNQAELRADIPGGARISLFGADNPDAVRGIYLDGVVLDEFAQMPARMWSEILRPALADRKGSALWIGTPMGRNEFYKIYQQAKTADDPEWFAALYKASETGVIPAGELAAIRRDMTEDQYAQEMECSFEAAIAGAYYGKEMAAAEAEKRITRIPYEPGIAVDTWWDLGVGDSTAVWFVQRVGREIRLIDYLEASGEGLPFYAKELQTKPYVYGRHIAPHDIAVRELGSGKARIDTAANLGIRFEIAPKLPIDDGINAARLMLARCWFDRERCRQGIECLKQYRKDWDDRLRVFRSSPRHDWASHGADAFRYGASALEGATDDWSKPLTPEVGWIV